MVEVSCALNYLSQFVQKRERNVHIFMPNFFGAKFSTFMSFQISKKNSKAKDTAETTTQTALDLTVYNKTDD